MLPFVAIAQTWQPMGPSDTSLPSDYYVQYTSMALDSQGLPYMAYQDGANGRKATVRKFNGNNWVNVGTPGFSEGLINSTSIAIDHNGIPYIAYIDEAHKAIVKKYNGSIWIDVGGVIAGGSLDNIKIATDSNGVPYVAYAAGGGYAVVKKYINGNWVDVGTSAVSNQLVPFISIVIGPTGTPYVIGVIETSGGYISPMVKKFDGSNWVDVGTPPTSTSSSTECSMAFDPAGNPYVTYSDPTQSGRITVKKFDGSNWVTIGLPGSLGAGPDQSIAVDGNGTPFVSFVNGNNGWKYTVKKFNGTDWIDVGAVGSLGAFGDFGAPARYSIAIDANGIPYLGGINILNGRAAVKKFNGTNWVNVRGGFSTDVTTSIAINKSGVTYVAFRDNESNKKATVKKYNGTSWVDVGRAGFSADTVETISIVIDANGTPYVVYRDFGKGKKATVKKFDGSNWVDVGVPGFSPGMVDFTSIAINPAGIPYVVYTDYSQTYKATVKKFDGGNWVDVGLPGLSVALAIYTSIAIDHNGVPYVVYLDLASNPSFKATVKKFDGTSWVNVGVAGFSAGEVSYTDIAIDGNNIPYVVYKDGGNGGRATVKKYNGTSWADVGNPGFSIGYAPYTSIVIDAVGAPYVAYQDGYNNSKATVKKFNGTGWVDVGAPGFSAGQADYTSIAITPGGNPVVVYSDGQATFVKSFSLNIALPLRLGSLLVEKTAQGSSNLKWTSFAESDILYFEIERSTNGSSFETIGKVSSLSNNGATVNEANYQFTDRNPVKGNNYYRIKVIGSNNYQKVSNIVHVKFEGTFLIDAFPNPLIQKSTITISLDKKAVVQIRVTDIMGKLIWQEKKVQPDGINQLDLSTSQWPSGIYVLEVILPEGEKRMLKLVKL